MRLTEKYKLIILFVTAVVGCFVKKSLQADGKCLPKEWEGQYESYHLYSSHSDFITTIHSDRIVLTSVFGVDDSLTYAVICCPDTPTTARSNSQPDEQQSLALVHQRILPSRSTEVDCFKLYDFDTNLLLYTDSDQGSHPLGDCSQATFSHEPLLLVKTDEFQHIQSFANRTKRESEKNDTFCDSNLCVNGVCIETGSSFRCHCFRGYLGTLCEIPVSPCESDPCKNGAVCQNNDGRFRCVCALGFYGDRCELRTSEVSCEGAPCENGGTCSKTLDGFVCECPPGIGGWYCEVKDKGCKPNPCSNSGTCVVGKDGDVLCVCTSEYGGTRCELAAEEELKAKSTEFEKALRMRRKQEQNKTDKKLFISIGVFVGLIVVAAAGFYFIRGIQNRRRTATRFKVVSKSGLETRNPGLMVEESEDVLKLSDPADSDELGGAMDKERQEARNKELTKSKALHYGVPEQELRKNINPVTKKKKKVVLYNIVRTDDQQANAMLHRDRVQERRFHPD